LNIDAQGAAIFQMKNDGTVATEEVAYGVA